jgi:hypothetical protein
MLQGLGHGGVVHEPPVPAAPLGKRLVQVHSLGGK